MGFSIMRFEMRFEIAQGIDPRAAAFADGRALLGGPHGQFLEHGRQQ